MLGGEARDLVAGFWRALGLAPPPEPDQLVTLLAFYAGLLERAEAEPQEGRWAHAQKAFLWEHLLSWLPFYLDRVRVQGGAFFAAWADLLQSLLLEAGAELGPPAVAPLSLRRPPPGPGPELEDGDLAPALLAPALSGVIITRSDLARCAGELELGLRQGGRAFILNSLFEQDWDRTLTWLEAEFVARERSYRGFHRSLSPVTGIWRRRANAASAQLRVRLGAPPGARRAQPREPRKRS